MSVITAYKTKINDVITNKKNLCVKKISGLGNGKKNFCNEIHTEITAVYNTILKRKT